MKINIARSAGFCFGVKRAIDVALSTARSGGNIRMLGDIVHNADVVGEIKKSGIKKIGRLSRGGGKVLLIRAHGAPLSTYKKAEKSGYTIVDATCPMVKGIHKIARSMEPRYDRIIVIGDRRHDEVLGIVGQLKRRAIVIDDIRQVPFKGITKIKNACVVVQSTQNLDKVLEIVHKLKRCIGDVKFINTICNPTRVKQEEIKLMPKTNDVMIIIGSKNSANTKRLYQISKSLNKNSYWIDRKDEIRPAWFKGIRSVGVTAGASTPERSIREVVRHIHLLAGRSPGRST